MKITVREVLFRNFDGCSSYECFINDCDDGMKTNGRCMCLHNMSRAQLSTLRGRIAVIADKDVELG